MNKYNLTFNKMIKKNFKHGGWYQGENFSNGTFLKIEEGIVKVYSFGNDYYEDMFIRDFYISNGTVNQKYCRVYTQPEIMKKV